VLAEVAHKLMTLEASRLFNRPLAGLTPWLRKHPAEVQRLTLFHRCLDRVVRSRVQVLTVSPAVLMAATVVSQQTGLLTNDAQIVAVMQANGLTKLASHDADFDRVPGLTRYAPA
jgi:predicted nucleic acid-binding protein